MLSLHANRRNHESLISEGRRKLRKIVLHLRVTARKQDGRADGLAFETAINQAAGAAGLAARLALAATLLRFK
jgi:hypothetical protein